MRRAPVPHFRTNIPTHPMSRHPGNSSQSAHNQSVNSAGLGPCASVLPLVSPRSSHFRKCPASHPGQALSRMGSGRCCEAPDMTHDSANSVSARPCSRPEAPHPLGTKISVTMEHECSHGPVATSAHVSVDVMMPQTSHQEMLRKVFMHGVSISPSRIVGRPPVACATTGRREETRRPRPTRSQPPRLHSQSCRVRRRCPSPSLSQTRPSPSRRCRRLQSRRPRCH